VERRRRYQKTDKVASRSLSLHLGMKRSEISENRNATKQISETAVGEKQKTVNRSKTRDLAAGLEISTKAADIWVQTDEISCMMTEITTYASGALCVCAHVHTYTCVARYPCVPVHRAIYLIVPSPLPSLSHFPQHILSTAELHIPADCCWARTHLAPGGLPLKHVCV